MRAKLPLLLMFTTASAVGAQTPRPRPEPAGHYVVVGGHRLWYRITGRGEPLLVIPGGPGAFHAGYWLSIERLAPYAALSCAGGR